MIIVKFFGPLAEIIGASELRVDGITHTKALEEKIRKDFPMFANYKTLVSVNKRLVQESQALKDGDEVAFLPPFAGG